MRYIPPRGTRPRRPHKRARIAKKWAKRYGLLKLRIRQPHWSDLHAELGLAPPGGWAGFGGPC